MNAGIETLCNRVLGALFNGGYQGLLLTLLIWLSLKMIRRTNAATRHAVAMVALILVALLPVVHFVLPEADQLTLWRPTESSETHSEFANDFAGLNLGNLAGSFEATRPLELTGGDTLEQQSVPISEEGEAVAVESIDEPESVPISSGATIFAFFTERLREFLSTSADWWRLPVPRLIGVGVVALWIILSAARIGNLAWQYWILRSLKYRGGSAPAEIITMFNKLRTGLRMKRKPAVVVCSGSGAPMVAGFRHPAVLLPAAIVRDAGRVQIEQILRHELAHVARADDWANLVQQVIKGVLFFHPAVWWLSKRLTIEREIACDDYVLTAPGTPQAYALFLTEFARRTQCRDWVAAPAAWSKRSQLTERISMILDSKRNSSPRLARAKAASLAAVAALLAIWGLRAGPRVALAAERPEPKSPPSEPTEEVQSVTEVHSDSTTPLPSANLPEPPQTPSRINVPSGPRPKPFPQAEIAVGIPPRPYSPPAPSLALAGSVSVDAPTPAVVARAPGKRKDRADNSIDQRLDRLERMVETLLARDKERRKTDTAKDFGFNYKMQNNPFAADEKGLERWKSGTPTDEDVAKLKDFAKHQAEIAGKEAQRATREIEKSRQDIARIGENGRLPRIDGQMNEFNDVRESFEVQRQQLEAQRKALEKQMHALEKQLNRLNEEQEKVNKHRDEDHEKRANRLNADNENPNQNKTPGESLPKKKHKSDKGDKSDSDIPTENDQKP